MRKYSCLWVIYLLMMFNLYPKDVQAESLSEIVSLSLLNSNTFKEAVETYKQNYMYKKMATGYLFPSVTLEGGYNVYNKQKIKANCSDKNALSIKNTGYSISLKVAQPLFNYQVMQQYQKASIIGDMARTQLEIDRNDLILKTVQAYLKVLSDKEQIRYYNLQEGYITDLKKAAEAKLKVGKAIAIDVEQINARLAQLHYISSLIQNSLVTDIETLNSLVGVKIDNYNPLSDAFVNIEIPQTSLEDWKKQVLSSNLNLLLAHLNIAADNYDIAILKSGYYPSISLYASHGYNKSKIENNKQDSKLLTDTTIGINFTMNLFKGGLDRQALIQSRHKHNAMLYQVEQLKAELLTKTTNYYNNIYNGMNQIQYLLSSAKSNKLYLEMTLESYSLGLKTNTDILNAAQTYAEILNQLSEAKYNLILSILSLKAIAGYVSIEDIQEFDKYF